MIKRITFIRVALSFLIVCLLVVPLDVSAASGSASYSHNAVGITGFKNYVETEYILFTADNYYTETGSVEYSDYKVFRSEGSYQGIYHIKYKFDPTFFLQHEFYGYDSYIVFGDSLNNTLDLSYEITSGNASASDFKVINVQKYYEVLNNGNTFTCDFDNVDLFVNGPRLGSLFLYPVIEFDVVLNLEHFNSLSNGTSSTIGKIFLSSTSSADSYLTIYGCNYIDSGQNAILSKLDNLISTIISKFDSLSTFLSGKFSELFKILEDDQEELINGFQGSGTDQASTNFDISAGELHSAENQLTNVTNTSVNTYTDFAFDTTVLTTLGASLVYVVTWFTNFWDIGGLFTALLNIGLALFVAFFILRLRGSK